MPSKVVSGISYSFPQLSQSQGQIAHVLLTRSPLIKEASSSSPFDLHVLSTPPAFVLSQDQTLRKCLNSYPTEAERPSSAETRRNRRRNCKFETSKNKSLLTCFCYFAWSKTTTFNSYSKGISQLRTR